MKATALYRPLASLVCRMQDRKHYLDVEAKLQKKGCGPAREEQHLTIRDRHSVPQRTYTSPWLLLGLQISPRGSRGITETFRSSL